MGINDGGLESSYLQSDLLSFYIKLQQKYMDFLGYCPYHTVLFKHTQKLPSYFVKLIKLKDLYCCEKYECHIPLPPLKQMFVLMFSCRLHRFGFRE